VRAIKLKTPGRLDKLELVKIRTVEPRCGGIRVRNHASSLNFHDYVVAIGLLPVADGRIPMSDGAGSSRLSVRMSPGFSPAIG
jgi:NADPH:quinone reductase-like Zn-dependent oxidoreductase